MVPASKILLTSHQNLYTNVISSFMEIFRFFFVFVILKNHHNITRCRIFLISSLAFYIPFQYEIFTLPLIESFIEMTIDTHAVVKNNIARSLYTCTVSHNDSNLHTYFCSFCFVIAWLCFIFLIISLIFF